MKVGDLVYDNCVNAGAKAGIEGGGFKFGVLVARVQHSRGLGCKNKVFRVLWNDGTIGNNVWDYDLKMANESR